MGEVIEELLDKQYLPSFCTPCYGKGGTGEHFRKSLFPGFISVFCTQNAILTLAEYLEDYATVDQKTKGYKLIDVKIEELNKKDSLKVAPLLERLDKVKHGERDLYF